jgi:TRAP-type mannitol/chloroaromatic compound transport system permease large subunit
MYRAVVPFILIQLLLFLLVLVLPGLATWLPGQLF